MILTLIDGEGIPSVMSRSAQSKFRSREFKTQMAFGGSRRTRLRDRSARPMSSKDPVHLVLRSTKAKGAHSFGSPSNLRRVNEIVRAHCARYGVKLIEYSNNFNHLHLLVKFGSRAVYLRFIRSLTGSIALAVSGCSKIKSLKAVFGEGGFWDFRPFTRIVRSWPGYRVARDYVVLNQLEAAGVSPKRKGRLRDVTSAERHFF